MAERSSALAGQATKGRFGDQDSCGVILSEMHDLQLHQVAVWPDTQKSVGELAAAALGTTEIAAPGQATGDEEKALLRVEPLKYWLLGAQPPQLDAEQGVTLDLSHSRTRVQISGAEAVGLLNRLLPLDLREHIFPVGSVALSAIHHVGITLWRNEAGYELFVPRGYAVSVWQVLFESALQFGVEVN